MQNKVALVTGGGGAIGTAVARCLAKEGWRVALFDQDATRLEAVLTELPVETARSFVGSVIDEEAVAAALAEIESAWGGLDAVVHCAGVGGQGSVEETTFAEWRRIVDINLHGTFLVFHCALPYLRRRGGGQIVSVLSVAARQTFAGQGSYCASKWGAYALTRVLAEEVRREGIRVTSVFPGATNTGFWDSFTGTDNEGPSRDAMMRPESVAASVWYALNAPEDASVDEVHVLPRHGIL
jgi:NADP-dependent 3-hydroxy acid dehydrogenase YdfG